VEEQLFKPLSGIIKNIISLGLFKEVLKDKSSYKDSNINPQVKRKATKPKKFLLERQNLCKIIDI